MGWRSPSGKSRIANHKCIVDLHRETHDTMRLALSKKGLGSVIENEVWHYAFIAPSAKAMKWIAIEDQGRHSRWTRKRITPKAGVHVKAGMGRKIANPCSMCEEAELTCVTDYCGQCR